MLEAAAEVAMVVAMVVTVAAVVVAVGTAVAKVVAMARYILYKLSTCPKMCVQTNRISRFVRACSTTFRSCFL